MWLSKQNFLLQFPVSKNNSNPTPSMSVHVKYQRYWLFSLIQIWVLSGASSNTESTTFQRVNLSHINSKKNHVPDVTLLGSVLITLSVHVFHILFFHFEFVSQGYNLQEKIEIDFERWNSDWRNKIGFSRSVAQNHNVVLLQGLLLREKRQSPTPVHPTRKGTKILEFCWNIPHLLWQSPFTCHTPSSQGPELLI